jgi:NADP-dependent 3-hydroxy acid dehydrogenase YdfG
LIGAKVLSADRQIALVTGASSGIGAETVRALAARGHVVHALARRRDRLEALAQESGCIVHVADLRDRKAVADVLAEVPVDILINNAGVSLDQGPLYAADPVDIDEMLEVNLAASLHILRQVIAGMVLRKRGHVVIVGSVGGLYPMPGSSVYSATKAALHAVSHVLRYELLGQPLRVTEVVAGRVTTEIFDRKSSESSAASQFLEGRAALAPSDVAQAIVYALDAPATVNISRVEILPVGQVVGGLRFAKPATVSEAG